MTFEARIDYEPLVTIIVVVTEDEEDSARRIAEANSQTWRNLEVIPVKPNRPYGFGEAINKGLSISRGEYVSLLLPNVGYTLDKIARQLAFMDQFDLWDAAVFCDYTLVSASKLDHVSVTLPSIDPSAMFRKMYCGMQVESSTLLVARKTILDFGMFDEKGDRATLQGFLLSLSRHTDLVGMAATLVSKTMEEEQTAVEKSYLRNLYVDFTQDVIHQNRYFSYDSNLYSILGEAAIARINEGLPLAAWDVFSAAIKSSAHSGNILSSVKSFCKPLLRQMFKRLPASIKSLLRKSQINHAVGSNSRLDFSLIYRDNGFVGTESLSGAGSTWFQTRVIRHKLPELFRELGVKRVLDIPCGDFHWMQHVELGDVHYTGADVVKDLVHKNRLLFGNDIRTFECINLITGPLPYADLVFCRDCLVHLPNEDVLSALEIVRQSGCKWFLTTTFTRDSANCDLSPLGWRPLNLTLPPFDLPKPILLISEKCTEAGGLAADKSLGLWRISDMQKSDSNVG